MKNIFSSVLIAAVLSTSFSVSVLAADIPTKPASTAPVVSSAKPVAAPTVSQEAININTADAQSLIKLKGIGSKKADAIVAYRKANGAFKSVDQLAEVKGIGSKIVDANRKVIRI